MNPKDYITSKLNTEQTKAALHTDTASLIIAGAGSGKTRVLTYKIAYLLRGLKVPVSRVLAVTFTNKAANEMKERLIGISEELPNNITTERRDGFSTHPSSIPNNTHPNNEAVNTTDLSDFISAMEQSKPASNSDFSLSPQNLKRI
jgi:DNA helicase-2/ATP-dependent DNA helicase PcrA